MPKYNSRPRKRRSALQKAQAKSLAQWRQRRKEAQQAENGISAGDDKPHTPTSSNVNQMIKERDRKVETLEKNCKNAVQRDKRGKEKIERLEASVDVLSRQLSDTRASRDIAESALHDIRVQAGTVARAPESAVVASSRAQNNFLFVNLSPSDLAA